MADNTTLARSIYDAWNARDFDRIAETMAPDAKITLVGTGQSYNGPNGAREFSKMWADPFPDGVDTIDRVIAEGDYVAVMHTGRGTHTGTLTTPMGSIPATGRSVTLELCDVLEFKDGKVKSQRQYLDTASMLAQLGVSAGQAARTT
jgi:steroid delta-isomerase-like uncharacterized protein